MSLDQFIKHCKQNPNRATLREFIPGRGKSQREQRNAIRRSFDMSQGEIDGVVLDKARGIFQVKN